MTDELEFPNGKLPVGIEFAFGADPAADPTTWTWTDLTPQFLDQQVTTTRGRADESSDVSPSNSGVELDNESGDLTPDDARSQYWPDVDVGTPGRWWVEAGTSRLYVPPMLGAGGQVASTAALNITADLDVRIDMQLKTTHASGEPARVASRGLADPTFSWSVTVLDDRRVRLAWSATGSVPFLEAYSTMPVVPSSARATLRVTLDVNNGAAGNTATFYLGDSVAGPFTQIGDPVVTAGTTTIANTAEPLVVGSPGIETTPRMLDADVYAFQLRDGIGGATLADADFTAQPSPTTTFVDIAGRTWTVEGAAELSNRWFRMVGTADEWNPFWPEGDLSDQIPGGLDDGEARVEVTLSGILRRLGQGQSPLQSALRRAYQVPDGSSVAAYWPMEDLDGSTWFASALPDGSPMTVSGEVDFAAVDTLVGSAALPTLSATTSLNGAVAGTFGYDWSVEWFAFIPTPSSPVEILQVNTSGTVQSWVVAVDGAIIAVIGRGPLGTSLVSSSVASTLFYDRWVMLRLRVFQSGSSIYWTLEWYPVTHPASSGFSIGGSLAATLGAPTAVTISPGSSMAGASTGHIKVIKGPASGAPSDAAVGWVGETAVARMDRLSTEQAVPFRIIGARDTSALVGAQNIATYLTLMDDAQDADGGILYEQRDAVGLVYRTRESLYNQPANLILDAHQQQIQNPFRPARDDQRLRNDVTVTRRGGSSTQVVDEPSVERRGRYDEAVELNLYVDTQTADAAGWRLRQGTVPGMRYPQLTINLGPAPELIEEWLAMDTGSRAHVINLPPQHPTDTVRELVEGYSEPISPVTWMPEMSCSPASVWDVGQIDGEGVDDAFLLRLDTDGSEVAVAVDTDDTTLRVAVTAGPAWTADNAETPFDILVGGERMTVTDVAAETGAAAFTGAGNGTTVSSVSHVAPSVVAPAIGDLLICMWCSYVAPGTYTIPGTMSGGTLTSGVVSSARQATQTLAAAGATGTRTATYSVADRWSSVSVVAHGDSGSPTVLEVISGMASGATLSLSTTVAAVEGDTLLLLQAWDWDPGNNMQAPDDTWSPVADSFPLSVLSSRTRAWSRRVTDPGVQQVMADWAPGINDNHGRLYLLRGVIGVTQAFTVVRSVNSVVRSHAPGTDVRLWFPPILAR